MSEEKTSRADKKVALYTTILVFGVTIWLFTYRQNIRDKKLESKHKYTIGFLKKFVWPAEGGEMADVYFFVNHSTYRPSFTLNQGDKQKYKIEQRFFIKFNPDDPDICEILFDKVVPDTMTHFKIAGWDSIPIND